MATLLPENVWDPSALESQILSFLELFFIEDRHGASCLDMLNFILKNRLRDLFPDVEIVPRIFYAPVSAASNERAFSIMRRICSRSPATNGQVILAC